MKKKEIRQANLDRSRRLLRGTHVPREVRLKGIWQAKGVWASQIFLVVVFVLLLGVFIYDCLPAAAVRWGQTAQAQVKYKVLTNGYSDLLALFGIHDFLLELAFPVGNKVVDCDVGGVPGRLFEQIPIGSTVNIHYLPSFPGQPSLDLDPATFWCLLGVPLGFFFPWLLTWAFHAQKRILIKGLPTEGVVTRIYLGNRWLLDFTSTAYVSFSWEGKTYDTVTDYYGYGDKNDPGDEVLVLVNPKNPKDGMVYDDLACSWRLAEVIETGNS